MEAPPQNTPMENPLPRGLDHPWHCWINQYSHAEMEAKRPWVHSLYEFKNMLQELPRLQGWIKRARTGDLPTVHQQCSHCSPEHIHENKLLCALGVNVNECSILSSLRQSLKSDSKVTEDDADRLCSLTCAWHIFKTAIGAREETFSVDTSEGYVQDESDRMFWSNVYESMASVDAPDSDCDDSVSNGTENQSTPLLTKTSASPASESVEDVEEEKIKSLGLPGATNA